MIDLYFILQEEWFEQIGDFSDNDEEFAPIDYEPVTTALYRGDSFYGPELVDLLLDCVCQPKM